MKPITKNNILFGIAIEKDKIDILREHSSVDLVTYRDDQCLIEINEDLYLLIVEKTGNEIGCSLN